MTISTTASTVNGTYTITITGAGSSATHTATYTLTVTGGATSCSSFTNGTDYNIPDPGSVTSSITISGCTGNASATTTVSVDIKHTYRGDVYIDLIAPDGTSYRLKNIDGWDSADNILATYTVNVSTETKNGTWKLKVSDWYGGDSGWLDTWTLTF